MKQVVWGGLWLLAAGLSQTQAAETKPSCQVRQVTIRAGSDAMHSLRDIGVDRRQVMTWLRHAGRSKRAELRRLRPGGVLDVCLRQNGDLDSLRPSPPPDRSQTQVAPFAGVTAEASTQQQAPPTRIAPASMVSWAGVRGSAVTMFQPAPPKQAQMQAATTAIASQRIAEISRTAHLHTTELPSGHVLRHELARYLSNHLVVAALSDYVHNEWHLPARLPKGSRCTVALRPIPGEASRSQLAYLQVDYRGRQRRVYHYVDAHGGQYVVGPRGEGYRVVAPAAPVHYTRISSGWGWRTQPVLGGHEFHHGIDYAAPAGTPIRASMDGIVDISGWHGNYGRLIEIRHADGMSTRYGHLRGFASRLHVGTRVHRGDVIGYVGASGLSTGPHLYYEIWRDGERINPLTHPALMVTASLPPSERSAFNHYVDQQIAH